MIQPFLRLCCLLLIVSSAATVSAQVTNSNVAAAADEGVRRQEAKRRMQVKLADAQAAVKRNDIESAAKLYDQAVEIGKQTGVGVEEEMKQAVAGVVATRTHLARQDERRMDYIDADLQIKRMLSLDPRNPEVLALKKENDQAWEMAKGMMPSAETLAKAPEIQADKLKAATLVQDGRFLYENGRLEEATTKLAQALKLDPENRAATYYLELVAGRKYAQQSRGRETMGKKMIMEVENQWAEQLTRKDLDVPNAYARTNIVHTSVKRQVLYEKLRKIKLDTLFYENLPLSEVVKSLADDAQKRDPDAKGVNFLLSSYYDPPASTNAPAVDPNTGLPVGGGESVDISGVQVRVSPTLRNVTLEEALEVITKAAERPIKYSVEDWGVVISPKAKEPVPLHVRVFKIDPNTFMMGLSGVQTFQFGMTSAGQGGGGGGYGGGGYGGGGGGYGGGGRGGYGGGGGGYGGGGMGGYGMGGMGGMGGGSQMSSGTYAQASIAGPMMGGMMGGYGMGGMGGFGGVQQQQRGGQAGQAGQTGNRANRGGQQMGVEFLTRQSETSEMSDIARDFFVTAGVDLSATSGKSVFFNDRLGMLMVRATLLDLDIIEKAIQVLNMAPPEVTVKAKFLEISQSDVKALGFDWYLGNWVMGQGGAVGVQGGTAPSYLSPNKPTIANPSGVFPGPGPAAGVPGPYAVPPSATDNSISSGLRNVMPQSGSSIPAVATITGILTDPQFRVVIKALEQRTGTDLLSCPEVTTLSGRQTQIKVVDVRYIVTSLDISQTSGGGNVGGVGGIGGVSGGGGVASIIQPYAEPMELGPVLDVIPYVMADGYTIQMAIIPTVKEFQGYDDQPQFNATVQSVGGANAAAPLTATTPLPRFTLRQVATSAIVWDGQTVVLGGLLSETVMKNRDKIPVLGDLPWVGRLFTSEAKFSRKQNLMIFVTPRIIDPAGNPMHSDEEMPFAQKSAPQQKPPAN